MSERIYIVICPELSSLPCYYSSDEQKAKEITSEIALAIDPDAVDRNNNKLAYWHKADDYKAIPFVYCSWFTAEESLEWARQKIVAHKDTTMSDGKF